MDYSYLFRSIYLILLICSASYSRPVFTASFESNEDIYLGLEYKLIGVKFLVPPSIIGFGKQSGNGWSSFAAYFPEYGISLSKTFKHNDFKSGVDWRFRYLQIDDINTIYLFHDDINLTRRNIGSAYINSLGYNISKEFGFAEFYSGVYLRFDYSKVKTELYFDDKSVNKYDNSEMRIDIKLLMGISIRI